MFNGLASRYDRFNAWASFGLHHAWRQAVIDRIPNQADVLDIATGTGDLAFKASSAKHRVVGLDFSENMLAQARAKDRAGSIQWLCASADKLPISDRSFDCVTSAFALRNLRSVLDDVLRENFRVLRAGGKVLHLDFGRPNGPLSRIGHRLHLLFGVPFIGRVICGKNWPQNYLNQTIESFYEPVEMLDRLRSAGFRDVSHTSLCLGVVQLYEGKKC